MKCTKEQRLDIGQRIYDGEINRYEYAEEYGISEQTARNYMRMYRAVNHLLPKHGKRSIGAPSFIKAPADLDELKPMTKEELIEVPVKFLCKTMDIQRSGFYAWNLSIDLYAGSRRF